MIKVLLVDDEQPALDELEFLLKNYENIQIESKVNSAKKALEFVLLNEVDVVFLDISMPEMDGFMLAEALIRLRKPPYIVFATAYDDYAIKAFEVNAIDYLLKPISEDRLLKTIERLATVIENDATTIKLEPINKMLNRRYTDKKATRLPLWKNDRIHLISPKDISYIETKEGETHLYTKKGEFVSSDCLSHYEEVLAQYHFFRCHRSFIIHLDDVNEIVPWFNNTYGVKLVGYEDQIPISRRNVKEFKDLLNI